MPTGSGPRSIADSDAPTVTRPERLSLEARLLRRLLSGIGDPPVEFFLAWSGERIGPEGVLATERVRIADRGTLRGLLRDAQIRFGDAYASGRIEIDGDLIRFMETVFRSLARRSNPDTIAARIAGLLNRPRRNSLEGSRDNIHRHYDLGNEFYSLWLGETMALRDFEQLRNDAEWSDSFADAALVIAVENPRQRASEMPKAAFRLPWSVVPF